MDKKTANAIKTTWDNMAEFYMWKEKAVIETSNDYAVEILSTSECFYYTEHVVDIARAFNKSVYIEIDKNTKKCKARII